MYCRIFRVLCALLCFVAALCLYAQAGGGSGSPKHALAAVSITYAPVSLSKVVAALPASEAYWSTTDLQAMPWRTQLWVDWCIISRYHNAAGCVKNKPNGVIRVRGLHNRNVCRSIISCSGCKKYYTAVTSQTVTWIIRNTAQSAQNIKTIWNISRFPKRTTELENHTRLRLVLYIWIY